MNCADTLARSKKERARAVVAAERTAQEVGTPMQDQSIAGERWRAVAGYEGLYEVSDQGRLRSLRTSGPGKRGVGGLIGTVGTGGYVQGNLFDGRGGSRPFRMHVLVLEAFVGPRPLGKLSRHLDGNHANNRVENLAWGTQLENMADSIAHGTRPRGERHCRAKLTEAQVREIRRLSAAGLGSYAELGKAYGVTEGYIGDIVKRRRWAWLV